MSRCPDCHRYHNMGECPSDLGAENERLYSENAVLKADNAALRKVLCECSDYLLKVYNGTTYGALLLQKIEQTLSKGETE